MIHGIGVDITQIDRIGRILSRFAGRFLLRAFHESEIIQYKKLGEESPSAPPNRAQATYVASRWAVKEATFKAFRHGRVLFPEIYVLSENNKYPRLELIGGAKDVASQLGIKQSHLSISHDGDYAVAQVIFLLC